MRTICDTADPKIKCPGTECVCASMTGASVVLRYVFERGLDLPAPFRTCGTDRTADSLTWPRPHGA